jgi:hypothetical protein
MKLWRVPLYIVLCLPIGIGFQWGGARLNQFVVSANMEQMPVWTFNDSLASAIETDVFHKPIDGKTRFIIFSDVFPTQAFSNANGFTFSSAISIGDILIYAGIVISILGNGGLCFLPFWGIWQASRLLIARRKTSP